MPLENPRAAVLTPQQVRDVGLALYGDTQHSGALAGDLNMSDRTVRRLMSGKAVCHEAIARALAELIDKRAALLRKDAGDLYRIINAATA
jgi:hypothetical protein